MHEIHQDTGGLNASLTEDQHLFPLMPLLSPPW